jgi:hypothetical protein
MSTVSERSNVQTLAAARITQEILDSIQSINYGSVEITIHNGQVVQIERREKLRFVNDGARNTGNG